MFASGSYSGATTAEIARAAGVTEPVLYRHFASKRELYFACLDEAWTQLREALDPRFDDLMRSGSAEFAVRSRMGLREVKVLVPNLWIQAITEAGEDAEIRRFVRRHMRAVHDYVAGRVREGQQTGVVAADRDPEAEAWIFVASTLLVSVADRLGGALGDDELGRIAESRIRWLTGRG